MSLACERINTYEILEHVLGIDGLHPHRLEVVRKMREKIAYHLNGMILLEKGVVLDIGCGSGSSAYELALLLNNEHQVIGIDINRYAISKAKSLFADQENLSFYHGDLFSYLAEYPEQKLAAAICISVSMFIHDLAEFYSKINQSLIDGGIFIDAPFMFRDSETSLPEKFKHDTYAVCGCSMNMMEHSQIKKIFQGAGFLKLTSFEHDFDLMNFPVLFNDYPLRYLVNNFFKNIIMPSKYFGNISSFYLFWRTMKILFFFVKNKNKYASGEFSVVKVDR